MKITRYKKFICSSTEKADLSKLEQQMSTNAELNHILNTPSEELIKEIPEYRYLVESEDLIFYKNTTLLQAIEESCKWVSHSYFSLNCDKIIGFFAFNTDGDIVTDIKMFSLIPNNYNVTLAKDMLRILETLRTQYKEINWEAVPDNPINKAYEKTINKYNGTVVRKTNRRGKEYLLYTIQGE